MSVSNECTPVKTEEFILKRKSNKKSYLEKTIIDENDTPKRICLKHSLKTLYHENMIKGKKIKRLNQSVRRQKRKIVSMKQIISTLTKNNLLQQDEGNVLFDSFSKNKDLIQNLHKKNNNIKKHENIVLT